MGLSSLGEGKQNDFWKLSSNLWFGAWPDRTWWQILMAGVNSDQPRLWAIYFLVGSRESCSSWSNFQLGQASDSSFAPCGKVRTAVAPPAMTLALGRVPFGNGELRVGKGSWFKTSCSESQSHVSSYTAAFNTTQIAIKFSFCPRKSGSHSHCLLEEGGKHHNHVNCPCINHIGDRARKIQHFLVK